MVDITADPSSLVFDSVIAYDNFYSMLYAALLNKYLLKYDLAEQCHTNMPLRSSPWRTDEFADYSSCAATPSLPSGDSVNSFADLHVFIDLALRRVIKHLFSDYLVSAEITDKVELWFSELFNQDCEMSLFNCLVLDGELILKCWKAILYDFISSPKTSHRLPRAPFLFPFTANEGFFSYNSADDFVSYQALQSDHVDNKLIYVLPFPNDYTLHLYIQELVTEFSTGNRQFFSKEKINLVAYFENTVTYLDNLQASYRCNEKKIDAFFNSEEGKALLLSPVIPVIHSIIRWESPDLETYYNSAVFYFEAADTTHTRESEVNL